MQIDRDRLLEQTQSIENPLFRYWVEGSRRASSALRSVVGRATERRISAASNAGSMTPATLRAILS